jgi:HSP20 family protein
MKTLMRSNGNVIPTIPSLLSDLLADNWFDSSIGNWRTPGTTLPAVNIMESNDQYIIEVAAPGMKREDFKVELDNQVLTISSEQQHNRDDKDKDGNFTRREFSYHSFQRSFRLPKELVEGEKIEARYTDGILVITVPKREEAKVKPPKQITVG